MPVTECGKKGRGKAEQLEKRIKRLESAIKRRTKQQVEVDGQIAELEESVEALKHFSEAQPGMYWVEHYQRHKTLALAKRTKVCLECTVELERNYLAFTTQALASLDATPAEISGH